MKTHFCINCETEQGSVGEIPDNIYCDRCGGKIHADGSSSYDASKENDYDIYLQDQDYLNRQEQGQEDDLPLWPWQILWGTN